MHTEIFAIPKVGMTYFSGKKDMLPLTKPSTIFINDNVYCKNP